MVSELDRVKANEAQWRQIVQNLKKDIDLLQARIKQHQDEQIIKVVTNDQNHSLEIKMLKNENLAIKQDNKCLFDKISDYEQIIQDKDE